MSFAKGRLNNAHAPLHLKGKRPGEKLRRAVVPPSAILSGGQKGDRSSGRTETI